jgi:dynein heavy chain
VTPTSFLELISTFIQLLNEKKNQVTQQRDRYANGYKTLIETEKKVNEMSAYLETLQPKLVVKAEEVAKQSVIVEKEAADAQIIADDVGKDAAVAKESADKSDAIATDCKEALAEAMPALKAAEKALEGIGPKDITMIKSVQSPTVDTLMVMTTVCILLKIAPLSKMNPETQKKEFDYWKPA